MGLQPRFPCVLTYLSTISSIVQPSPSTTNLHNTKMGPVSALMFSASDFPSDILQEIFEQTCYPPHAEHMSSRSAEIQLSHVCQSWRTHLLSTSSFWSTINLGCEWTRKSDAPIRMQALREQRRMVETWLERSGDRPLFVTLECKDYAEDSEVEIMLSLANIAIVASARWEKVSVQSYPQVLNHIIPLIPHKTPLLTSIEFSMMTLERNLQEGLPLSNLTLVPFPGQMRSIDVSGLSILLKLPTFPNLSGTWDHLTDFVYVPNNPDELCLSIEDVYGLLACSPVLESVMSRVRGSPSSSSSLASAQGRHRLELQSLKALKLISVDHADFGPLLDCVETPNLEDLSIDSDLEASAGSHEGDVGWCHLHDFICRSRPPLSRLQVHGMPITSEAMVLCLSLVPGLLSLHLDGRVFDIFVVSMLTWKPCVGCDTADLEEGNILPDLQKLVIRDCRLDSSGERAIFTLMMHSRLIYVDMIYLDEKKYEVVRTLGRGLPSGILSEVWFTHPTVAHAVVILLAEDGKQSLIVNPIIRPYRKKGLLYFGGDYVDAYVRLGSQLQFEES